MAVMLAFLKVPLSWGEIVRRTFKEAFLEDNCLGMAAQLAYYFFFALFPALLMLIAIASYFPYHTLVNDLFKTLGGFAPPEVLTIITDQLGKIANGEQGGLFTLGMLTTIWSTSSAMTAIIDTLNAAYDIEEGRPWWKVRLTALGLTVGVALFILLSFGLVLAGPTLAESLANRFYLGPAFEWTWKILQWPVVFALVSSAFAIIYYFAPDAQQDWVWLTPGSIVATALWLLASLGFKYYAANMTNYTETYGALGGVMVLMLWFYITGVVILLGAEMNAEIEHSSPYGKDEGEKVPGERRKIGPARMRAWMARQRKGGKPPSADQVKDQVGDTPPDLEPPSPREAGKDRSPAPADNRRPLAPGGGFSDYVNGAGVVVAQFVMTLKSLRRTRA
jgi:membrane protein